jgi:hypothetical protein
MMGIQFPSSPTVGDLWPTPAVAGVPQYKWDGQAWMATVQDALTYVKRAGDTMSGNLGIGTSNDYPFQVGNATTWSFAMDSWGTEQDSYGSSPTNGAWTYYGRARGTLVAPAAVQNNDLLGGFAWIGADGSAAYPNLSNAAVNGIVDGPVSIGTVPMAITFNTGTIANAPVERLRIASNGKVKLPTPVAIVDADQVPTKAYVDTADALKADKTYVDTRDALKVAKTGDTMSFDLTITRADQGTPTQGYLFFGNSGGKYFGCDGTNLVFNGSVQGYGNNITTTGTIAAGAVNVSSMVATGALNIVNNANRWLGSTGELVITGNPYSINGGAWIAYSDERIKNVVGDYEYGLAAVLQLMPRRYTMKGNNTAEDLPPDKTTAPYEDSGSYNAAVAGTEFVGLVAQEAETVIPGMVAQTSGFIDGVEVDDLRVLNSSELVYALVNAVKELTARIEALEAV